MLGGYGALTSELYPTNAQAKAQEHAVQSGARRPRPVIIASLAGAYSFSAAIALLALIHLIDIAATICSFLSAKEWRWKAPHAYEVENARLFESAPFR